MADHNTGAEWRTRKPFSLRQRWRYESTGGPPNKKDADRAQNDTGADGSFKLPAEVLAGMIAERRSTCRSAISLTDVLITQQVRLKIGESEAMLSSPNPYTPE